MKMNAKHTIITSKSGGLEFPADWTLREGDMGVVLVSDFSSVYEIETDEEYERLEGSGSDWCDLSVRHLLLFEKEEVMEKFKGLVRRHSCDVRVLTEKDRIRYGI